MKLSSKVDICGRLRYTVPLTTLIQLYNAIALSHFDYGDIVYGDIVCESCTEYNLERLKKIQNQAARIISGSSIKI